MLSLLLQILRYSNQICTENDAKIVVVLHWISLNKMASDESFQASERRYNVIPLFNVFAIKNIGEMIILFYNVLRIKCHANDSGLILSF